MAGHDVAVLGAGHNGLVAAVTMARAGLDVLVVEANSQPGGCIWTERLDGGYSLERGAVDHGPILDIVDELDLGAFGLEYATREVGVAAAFGDGTTVLFPVDRAAMLDGLEGGGDAGGYERLAEIGSVVFGMIDGFGTPPTPGGLAAALRSLPGGDDMMRLVLASADAVVAEHLGDAHLASAIAMYGAHSQVPPFLPGTGLFALLLPASHGTSPGRPRGGSAALVDALVAALEAAGGRLELDARVTGIDDHGTGRRLRLGGSRSVDTDLVVSTIDVRRTARLLASPVPELDRAAARTHDGSLNVGEIKIDLALARRPAFGPLEAAPAALWMVQEEVSSLRRSYGDILAGRLPTSTALMWAAPSETDPTAAPPGAAVVWISAFMPLEPGDGPWTPQLGDRAATTLLDGFARVSGTDLRDHATVTRVTTPADWALRLGSTTGNPNHLDLTVDQILGWRPPGLAGHRTPLSWLYLSGAGTHPGGGLSGIPGRNAARAVIADRAGRRRVGVGSMRARERIASLRAALDLYRSLRR